MALPTESDVEWAAVQGWLNAEVDDEVRHRVGEDEDDVEVHGLDAIRACPACRVLDVEPQPANSRS
jgi:hypothetical protein